MRSINSLKAGEFINTPTPEIFLKASRLLGLFPDISDERIKTELWNKNRENTCVTKYGYCYTEWYLNDKYVEIDHLDILELNSDINYEIY